MMMSAGVALPFALVLFSGAANEKKWIHYL
jgi:hypothetical protein